MQAWWEYKSSAFSVIIFYLSQNDFEVYHMDAILMMEEFGLLPEDVSFFIFDLYFYTIIKLKLKFCF